MNILLVGHGAIGAQVAAALRGHVTHVICRPGREHAAEAALGGVHAVSSFDRIDGPVDLALECAGHGGLACHGPRILEAGIDLVAVSVGVLADPMVEAALRESESQGGATLHLASGACGALDALRAAREGGLDQVLYRGSKPPLGWLGTPAESRLDLHRLDTATVHFKGSARMAARLYPKNANVAAAVALAGSGFESTEVELVADPGNQRNIHELFYRGRFGEAHFKIAGNAIEGAPKSSALTAMSLISEARARMVS